MGEWYVCCCCESSLRDGRRTKKDCIRLRLCCGGTPSGVSALMEQIKGNVIMRWRWQKVTLVMLESADLSKWQTPNLMSSALGKCPAFRKHFIPRKAVSSSPSSPWLRQKFLYAGDWRIQQHLETKLKWRRFNFHRIAHLIINPIENSLIDFRSQRVAAII